MARWIVPAGTRNELNEIVDGMAVLDGEIVYNTDSNRLEVGFVDMQSTPGTPIFRYDSLSSIASNVAPVDAADGDLWYYTGDSGSTPPRAARLFVSVEGQWIVASI